MARKIDFAAELNEEQLAAATHGEEPQLILAGAGSGKTRAITYRIAWLVQERGVAPENVAALTFTNRAAAEMRERVEVLLGLHPLPAFVGTFHRFALRLLRMYGSRVELAKDFAILDSSDQLTLVRKALKEAGVSEENLKPQAVLGAISGAKNKLLGPSEYERQADDFWSRQVAKVYQHYQMLMRDSGGVDFDDMIRLSYDLLAKNDGICRRVREKYQWLLVDEFQDTNFAQLALIRQLVGDTGKITAVGDEDQGIYRWRGAELENILRFERYFPGAIIRKLERNYRSTQNILDAAGAVVANNENRRGKRLWTDAGAGDKLVVYRARDEQEEARWIVQTMVANESRYKWQDMAILVRTNSQTRSIEDELLRRGLSYSLIAGTRFYERAEIKDVMAYLRLLRRPDDPLSFGRVLNVPTRGIGKTTQDALERLAASAKKSAWEVLGDDRMLEFAFSSRAMAALKGFRQMIERLRIEADSLPLPALLRLLLDATGYLKSLDPKIEEDQARRENLQELINAAQQFTEENTFGNSEDLLSAFLDHVALVSDTDKLGGKGIALMTLHSAKGLEFSAVAVGGLEEGVLPHFNARNEGEEGIEEERRLLYVGMTRAKHRLYLSACRRRRVAGTFQDQTESRFMDELPAQLVQQEGPPELFQRAPPAWAFPERGPAAGPAAQNVFSFFGKEAPAELPFGGEAPAEPPTIRRSARSEAAGSVGNIRNGTRVRHAKLGLGKVLGIEGSGDTAKLDVFFEGVGRRKLVAKFANLEVL
jgi:DNA helicase-2/ATP-dependent DNA helicase PcrA